LWIADCGIRNKNSKIIPFINATLRIPKSEFDIVKSFMKKRSGTYRKGTGTLSPKGRGEITFDNTPNLKRRFYAKT